MGSLRMSTTIGRAVRGTDSVILISLTLCKFAQAAHPHQPIMAAEGWSEEDTGVGLHGIGGTTFNKELSL